MSDSGNSTTNPSVSVDNLIAKNGEKKPSLPMGMPQVMHRTNTKGRANSEDDITTHGSSADSPTVINMSKDRRSRSKLQTKQTPTLFAMWISRVTFWQMKLIIALAVACSLLGFGMIYCMSTHFYEKNPQPAVSFYINHGLNPTSNVNSNNIQSEVSSSSSSSSTSSLRQFYENVLAWSRIMRNWFNLYAVLHNCFVAVLCSFCFCIWLLRNDRAHKMNPTKANSIFAFSLLSQTRKKFCFNITIEMHGALCFLLIVVFTSLHLASIQAIITYDLLENRGNHALAATTALVTIIVLNLLFDAVLQSSILRATNAYSCFGSIIFFIRWLLVLTGCVCAIVYALLFESAGNVPALYPKACPNAQTNPSYSLLILESAAGWMTLLSSYSFSLDALFLLYTNGTFTMKPTHRKSETRRGSDRSGTNDADGNNNGECDDEYDNDDDDDDDIDEYYNSNGCFGNWIPIAPCCCCCNDKSSKYSRRNWKRPSQITIMQDLLEKSSNMVPHQH